MKKWYCVALFNLVVLALLGLTLRYKINFPLESLKQENLLHAHSHFAFNGWVSFLLQIIILKEFTGDYKKSTKFWNDFFLISTIINYAMIISFATIGYGSISIALTTAALWLSYVFSYKIYKTFSNSENDRISVLFVKASLFFLLLSSLGPYALAIIMASKSTHQYWYHNALYFFLHFQYNGWFVSAVLSLLMKKLEQSQSFNYKSARTFFLLLAVTCIPSYFFTSLWHHRPVGITLIIVVTAVLQTAALYFLWKLLADNIKTGYAAMPVICQGLYSLAIGAFILKVLLQFFAVYPQVGQLAFGFRPIIIGYLHLIFLAFISMYLLAFIADKRIIDLNYWITPAGLIIFAAGIIINEVLLALQGLASIFYLYIPKINLILFANTFVLVAGAILLFIAVMKNYAPDYSSDIHFKIIK